MRVSRSVAMALAVIVIQCLLVDSSRDGEIELDLDDGEEAVDTEEDEDYVEPDKKKQDPAQDKYDLFDEEDTEAKKAKKASSGSISEKPSNNDEEEDPPDPLEFNTKEMKKEKELEDTADADGLSQGVYDKAEGSTNDDDKDGAYDAGNATVDDAGSESDSYDDDWSEDENATVDDAGSESDSYDDDWSEDENASEVASSDDGNEIEESEAIVDAEEEAKDAIAEAGIDDAAASEAATGASENTDMLVKADADTLKGTAPGGENTNEGSASSDSTQEAGSQTDIDVDTEAGAQTDIDVDTEAKFAEAEREEESAEAADEASGGSISKKPSDDEEAKFAEAEREEESAEAEDEADDPGTSIQVDVQADLGPEEEKPPSKGPALFGMRYPWQSQEERAVLSRLQEARDLEAEALKKANALTEQAAQAEMDVMKKRAEAVSLERQAEAVARSTYEYAAQGKGEPDAALETDDSL